MSVQVKEPWNQACHFYITWQTSCDIVKKRSQCMRSWGAWFMRGISAYKKKSTATSNFHSVLKGSLCAEALHGGPLKVSHSKW